jgi:hypothetical protein
MPKRFVVVIEADDLTESDDLQILVSGNDQVPGDWEIVSIEEIHDA